MDVQEDNKHLDLWDEEAEEWMADQPTLLHRIMSFLILCLVGGIGLAIAGFLMALCVFVFFLGALFGGFTALTL